MADKETHFTFRVDAALKAAFVEAVKTTDRSASLLLRDFMRDYIARVGKNERKSGGAK